ncbi:matrix [Vesiculovirus jurona]|uniref:Matrix protein n=1 Tax=Vesiculovirus jurona TaxID=1972568 RepID=I1SV82_9RHAB|nr:matrix [Vesiculovirus jurona]AEG25346.1 matrix protein [Vesiculovirus jurona]AJR28387.1 matrix [Vesiculovirus jurona]
MKSFKGMFKNYKEKNKVKKEMDWDSPPSYTDVRRGIYPSAPLFGLDDSFMETLPSLGIQNMKLQYKCSIQLRAEFPFVSYSEVVMALSQWDEEYRGFLGKRPFYRAIILRTSKTLKAVPLSLTDGGRPEYNGEIQGQSSLYHSLGIIPPMMYVPETFMKEWKTAGNRGILIIKIWLGITDTLDTLDPLLHPMIFKSERELVEMAKVFNLDISKGRDNNWIISRSY